MNAYYLYKVKRTRLIFIEEFKAAGDEEVRAYVAKHHPKLRKWDALRTKYVSDRTTGAMTAPPYKKPKEKK